MRPCRYDHPTHSTLRRNGAALLLLLLFALFLLGGCTTDARITPATDGAMIFEGQPIGWDKLVEYAEFRQDVLGVRGNLIQWQLLETAYDANPIPIPQEYQDFQFNRIYRQFAPAPGSLADGEKAFKTQYKIGTVIPVERFELEVMRQPKLEALVLQEHPISEETLREQFDQTPQDQLFQMFGPSLGMAQPAPIRYEQVKFEFRSMSLQQQLAPYTTDYLANLVATAEKDGRLVINRLPGEVTAPPVAGDTEEVQTPLPDSLARAAERLKADREAKTVKGHHATGLDPDIAYVIDGVPARWSTILNDPIALLGLRRHAQTLGWILAIDYAYEQEGLTIDQELYDAERDRMLRSIGGESQMQATLNNMGISHAMFEDQITREVKLRQLLLKAYPVEEQALRDRYASMKPAQWFAAYKPVLDLKSESEVSYSRVRDQLYQDAVNSVVSEKKQAYLDTLTKLLVDRRVMLITPDPMGPEIVKKPMDLPPPPIINGLSRLPFAAESVADALHLPEGEVHIPVSDQPAPDGAGHDEAPAGDGHGH